MEHGELAVGRGMDVELDVIGTRGEGRLHGGDRVLDLVDNRLADARRGAGVVLNAGEVEVLMHAAMRDKARLAGLRRCKP